MSTPVRNATGELVGWELPADQHPEGSSGFMSPVVRIPEGSIVGDVPEPAGEAVGEAPTAAGETTPPAAEPEPAGDADPRVDELAELRAKLAALEAEKPAKTPEPFTPASAREPDAAEPVDEAPAPAGETPAPPAGWPPGVPWTATGTAGSATFTQTDPPATH